MSVVEEQRSWLLRGVHLLWTALAVLAGCVALTIAEHGSAAGAALAAAVWLATGFGALGTIGLRVAVPGWFGALALGQVIVAGAAALAWPSAADYDGPGHAALPGLLGHRSLSPAAERHWSDVGALLLVATVLLGLALWLGIRRLSRRAGWEERRTGLPWLWYLAWTADDVRHLRGEPPARPRDAPRPST